jgi:hypothetical protein
MTWLPSGPVPFRVNLLSVLAGAGTAVFAFLTAQRLTRDSLATIVAALLLAVHPLIWEWSLVAEVFALNAFLASAEIYALIRWDARSNGLDGSCSRRSGSVEANHHTIVFCRPRPRRVAPSRLADGTSSRRRSRAAVSLAGLSTYIPWRRYPPIAGLRPPARELPSTFCGPRTFPSVSVAATSSGLRPIAWGCSSRRFRSPKRSRAVAPSSRGALCADISGCVWFPLRPFFAWFAISIRTRRHAWSCTVFVLAHVVVAPLPALAIVAMASGLARVWPRGGLAPGRVAVALGGFALVAAAIATEYTRVDQRANHVARTYAEDILATMPSNAVMLAGGDDVVLPVAYLQAVEHQRPDVTMVMLGPLSRGDWYLRELRAHDPRLVIPFDHYDPARGTATTRARSTRIRHVLSLGWSAPGCQPRRGLLAAATRARVRDRAADKEVPLAQMAADNGGCAGYRIPPPELAARPSFDAYAPGYAAAVRQVRQQYAAAHDQVAAAAWLRRALIMIRRMVVPALLGDVGGNRRRTRYCGWAILYE